MGGVWETLPRCAKNLAEGEHAPTVADGLLDSASGGAGGMRQVEPAAGADMMTQDQGLVDGRNSHLQHP
eukprot:NODE_1386_length_890_cov_148.890606_g1143_i0.p4 GENE.NODE_1386_length_890_cov_148.890606_g1143_i0~~NODE_1386_length_890_cov_148.890606_g1143_i0.p4  ORF type:complete len:69 (-),score=0.98 NODE_1386_length_890_cov_148.890606_g1143_i0:641-847(-)